MRDLNFEIEVKSENAIEDMEGLHDFIREEGLGGLKIEPRKVLPATGQMGGDTLAIISAIVGAPVVKVIISELLNIFKSYLHSKRESTIIVRNGDGEEFSITLKNIEEVNPEILAKLIEADMNSKMKV